MANFNAELSTGGNRLLNASEYAQVQGGAALDENAGEVLGVVPLTMADFSSSEDTAVVRLPLGQDHSLGDRVGVQAITVPYDATTSVVSDAADAINKVSPNTVSRVRRPRG